MELTKKNKTAIIIGAGPAGLTAAYELLEKTDIKPIILEQSEDIGGISKTVNYKGNYIDIGGHRFFSKSERVMDWWLKIMPLEHSDKRTNEIKYHEKTTILNYKHFDKLSASQQTTNVFGDDVMLFRNRVSRILYLRKLFSYPITLSLDTIKKLGILRVIKIGFSYFFAILFKRNPEKSLEDFFINRFGKELYETFFKDYTKKVWGVACTEISSEWGAQRVKGLSITKALLNAISNIFSSDNTLKQKNKETTLIERFLYPKYGPGHLWKNVAKIITEKGGEIHTNFKVSEIHLINGMVESISATNSITGKVKMFSGDYFFSTMPVKDLINSFNIDVPAKIKEVANGLVYRDFITVGVLVKKLKIGTENSLIPDNWIYVQEKDVMMGRIQIFNNWSPYMVKNKDTVWLGLEYFCNDSDAIWKMTEQDLSEMAIDELVKIGFIEKADVIDSVVIKMPKTYPAYFGTYNQFKIVREYLDKINNLFLIGRNGMHKYNNQDHSMLTAMLAVENIINNQTDKSNIWEVNTEEDYHEEK
ncbi:MAG: hypothetical protein A2046_04380 [Bacteroidetes bacterium GWA2_30_7]|nr:MAG: hypothetical protein A2046_04380 [Bacteroidetes bacterium GWA2_30_7]